MKQSAFPLITAPCLKGVLEDGRNHVVIIDRTSFTRKRDARRISNLTSRARCSRIWRRMSRV